MKPLIVIIVRFLRGQLNSNQLSPSAAEGVEVAVQCLEDAYGIIPADLQRSVLRLEDLLSATIRVPEDGDQISEEQKEQAENLKLLGNNLVRDGNYSEAIETYTRAIEIDPYNAVYFCNRAAAHIQRKNYIAGVNDCDEAVRLDPAYSKAYSRLGYAYQAMGNRGKAKESYEKACQLEPENEGYLSSLRKLEEMPGTASGTQAQADLMNILPGIDLSAIMKNPAFMQMASQMLEDPGLQTAVSRILAGQSSFPLANVQELISAGHQLAFHLRGEAGGEGASMDQQGGAEEGNQGSEDEDEVIPIAADLDPAPDAQAPDAQAPDAQAPVAAEQYEPAVPIAQAPVEIHQPANDPAPIPAAGQRVPEPVDDLEPLPEIVHNVVEEVMDEDDADAAERVGGDMGVPLIPVDHGPFDQDLRQGGGDADRLRVDIGGGGDAGRPH